MPLVCQAAHAKTIDVQCNETYLDHLAVNGCKQIELKHQHVQGHVAPSEGTIAAIAEASSAPQDADGIVITNFLHLPGVPASVSVELKPKCGFLATADSIHPENRTKWRVSRYQLHQHLKLQQVRSTSSPDYLTVQLFAYITRRCLEKS